MELVIAALIAVIFALLWVIDRQHNRHAETEKAHRVEIQGLCQRIQAPQMAVVQHATQDARDQPAVNAFDHQDYWEAKEEEAKALARIERLERELN